MTVPADSSAATPADVPVVEAPVDVVAPSDSVISPATGDAVPADPISGQGPQTPPQSETDGVTQPQTDTILTGADAAAADPTLLGSSEDAPVVPSTSVDPVGYQTVGDENAVVDNAALNAHAAETAQVGDNGFIVRGQTVDASQGTPAGLDVATPDNVHSDGGPTVYTDEEIDRLESLDLDRFEREVERKLEDLKDEENDLESMRGRHSTDDSGNGSTTPA